MRFCWKNALNPNLASMPICCNFCFILSQSLKAKALKGFCFKASFGFKALAYNATKIASNRHWSQIRLQCLMALKKFETHCFKVTLKQISCKNKVRSNEFKSGHFYRLTIPGGPRKSVHFYIIVVYKFSRPTG